MLLEVPEEMILALQAAYALLPGRRLDVGHNYGVYGPLRSGGFAVDRPRSEVDHPEVAVWICDDELKPVSKTSMPTDAWIAGISPGGRIAIKPMWQSYLTVPDHDPELDSRPAERLLKVAGDWTLWERGSRVLARGPKGKELSFGAPSPVRGAVALLSTPAMALLFDYRRPEEIEIHDLVSGMTKRRRMTIGPGYGDQDPELYPFDGNTVFYMADARTVDEGLSQRVPVIREREKSPEEEYYVRYLVRADLRNGAGEVIARVETTGPPLKTLRGLGQRAKMYGPDIAFLKDRIVVRANGAVYAIQSGSASIRPKEMARTRLQGRS